MNLAMKCMRQYCLLGAIATTWASAQLLPPAVKSGDQVDAVAITVTRFGPHQLRLSGPKGRSRCSSRIARAFWRIPSRWF